MSTDQPNNPHDTLPPDRLARVEENLAFTEHNVDQLSEEIRALGQRMQETLRRIDAIEQRLGKALEKLEPTEPE